MPAGDDQAFHIIYCRQSSPVLKKTFQRPVATHLLRNHPYALFVFSDKECKFWQFLNIQYEDSIEKRQLFRRITLRPEEYSRTAVERIALLDIESIAPELFGRSAMAIQSRHDEAFNVEKVTKDFYEEIANWYFWARERAVFPKDAPLDSENKPSLMIIRLLTRLIFCWFLREKRNPLTGKGLIPDELFDARSIKEMLKDPSPKSGSYYTAIPQNLFFATLNTEMDEPGKFPKRRFVVEEFGTPSNDHMIHQYWRNAGQLTDPVAWQSLMRTIPFLNGGLFECLDDRKEDPDRKRTMEIRIDGFSSRSDKQPQLPNFLFFGGSRSADLSKAYGDASHSSSRVYPLLEILHRYNFTLTESTPIDQEVALDPELLGHVFENLLASYNPETGSVARKATGSFYTPRVVVDWMVDRSLILYFSKTLRSESALEQNNDGLVIPDELHRRLNRLLSWDVDPGDFTEAEKSSLIRAIDRMRVIDPACGSGAFPMGMLQKLVHILKKIDPENKAWRAQAEYHAGEIPSAPGREAALRAVESAFARDNDDYGRKLFLIENCLFGVDIQPIAVQIAKLRFFIALIVDQSIDPEGKNYGILPLPNLETKIVAADTLMGLKRGQVLLYSTEIQKMEIDLKKIRHEYFTARNYEKKKDLRQKDKALCARLLTALTESGEYSPYDSRRLAEWNPYDTNKSATFFDPGWMFGLLSEGLNGVFDIVIGNPPYVRQEELKAKRVTGSSGKEIALKDALKEQYDSYTGTADLYVYFFERSHQILKTGGILSFITSNKYFRSAYGERLRTFLVYLGEPETILDFGDAPVFTSIAYPAIVVVRKTKHHEQGKLPGSNAQILKNFMEGEKGAVQALSWEPGPSIKEFPVIFSEKSFSIDKKDLKPDGWRIAKPASIRLLERLRKSGTPLSEYVNGRFYRGILTGLNEAFVVDRETKDRLIEEHPSSKEVLKPFLRGRDVKRWRCDPKDLWLIFTRRGCDIEKYPAIKTHLGKYKERLTPGSKGGRKPGNYKWFEIQDNIAYWQEFETPKIVYPDIALDCDFCLEESYFYLDCTLFFIPEGSRTLLSILNSNVVQFFINQISPNIRGNYFRFKSIYVGQIPIIRMNLIQTVVIKFLVSSIILIRKKNADNFNHFEVAKELLNSLIYELFFPEAVHSKNIHLFDEAAGIDLPDLDGMPEDRKLDRIEEALGKAFEPGSAIRGMLEDLKSIEEVKMIEEALQKNEGIGKKNEVDNQDE